MIQHNNSEVPIIQHVKSSNLRPLKNPDLANNPLTLSRNWKTKVIKGQTTMTISRYQVTNF